jgi:hypothetical protein
MIGLSLEEITERTSSPSLGVQDVLRTVMTVTQLPYWHCMLRFSRRPVA